MSKPLPFVLAMIGAISLLVAPLEARKPDFNGTWSLDPAASQFAEGRAATSGVLSFSRDGKKVHVAESLQLAHGESSREFELRVDDRYHPDPGSGEVIAKWEDDTLVAIRQIPRGGTETVHFSTDASGSTLTETVDQSNGPSLRLIWRHK